MWKLSTINFKPGVNVMNTNAIKIRNGVAPTNKHPKIGGSKYQALFSKMKKGQWFTLNSKDKAALQYAASTYLKGRYSLYKHPTMDCKYVFTLNK